MKIISSLAFMAAIVMLPLLAFGATCTTTGTGTWSNAAIWSCGNVPAPFTNYSVAVVRNGDVVTIDDVSPRTIPRTTVGDLTTGVDRAGLVIGTGVTVNLGGDLIFRAEKVAGNDSGRRVDFTMNAGSTLDLKTFKVQLGYYATWDYFSRVTWTITGNSNSHVTVKGSSGSYIDYYKGSSPVVGQKIVWSYADFSGIDSGTTLNNRVHGDSCWTSNTTTNGGPTPCPDIRGVYIDHCTFIGTAAWIFGTSNSYSLSNPYQIEYSDFRTITTRSGSDHVKTLLGIGPATQGVKFNYNTLSNNGNIMRLYFYHENLEMIGNVFDSVMVKAEACRNSVFTHNFFLNRIAASDFSFYQHGAGDTFQYNGYIGTLNGAHGLSTGSPSSSWSATDTASVWSHNFIHSLGTGDNPLRLGGSMHQTISNNIITGAGSGTSATALNATYSPTILIKNNTFTNIGSEFSGGSGSTMYMQEATGGGYPSGSPYDNAYTQFVNNLAINTSGKPSWLYAANVAGPNHVNSMRKNVYYDPYGRWTKFWNGSISISAWAVEDNTVATTCTANSFTVNGVNVTSRYTAGTWVRILQSDMKYRVGQVASTTYYAAPAQYTIVVLNWTPLNSALSVVGTWYSTSLQDVATGEDMGSSDLGSINPQVEDPLFTPIKWAEQQGQTGSPSALALWITSELIKRNGTSISGTTGQTPATFTVDDIWTAMTQRLAPRNPDLLTVGEGGTYIGAIQPIVDVTAPTITEYSATPPANGLKTPVTLAWNVTDFSSIAGYSVVGSDTDCSSALTGSALTHSLTWSGVKPLQYSGFSNSGFGTKYICLYALDSAGNVTEFAAGNNQAKMLTVTLTALQGSDTTPPTAPTIILNSNTSDLLDISIKSFACSDVDSGIAQYALYDLPRSDPAPNVGSITGLTWVNVSPVSTDYAGANLPYSLQARGDRRIYGWCRDAYGNTSGYGTADITVTPITTTPDLAQAIRDILYKELDESYPLPGQKVTLSQAIYMILQLLSDKTVNGTTMKVRGVSTKNTLMDPAMVFRLNSAVAPTAVSREQ